MHVCKNLAQWAFAVLLAAVAFLVCVLLGAFLTMFQVVVPPPAGFLLQIRSPGSLFLIACFLTFVPSAAATFVGAMTAPFAQWGLAAVVFPILVFASISLLGFAGLHQPPPNYILPVLLGQAATCVGAGGLVYIWWRRRRSRSAGD